jgi:hypothetical protein
MKYQSYIVISKTHIAECCREKAVELARRWGVPVIFRIHRKPTAKATP